MINIQVNVPFVKFTLPARNPWLINQPFELTLEAFNSLKPGSAAIVSDPIPIGVFDTCFTTSITPQNIV